MTTLQASDLLNVWERGVLESSAMRALLLAGAADTDKSLQELLGASIGERDAILLELYENLFGREIAGVARCDACGASFELNVDTQGIRVDFDRADRPHEFARGEYALRFRSVNSGDLLSLGADFKRADAERALLAKCVIEAKHGETPVEPSRLPADIVTALSEHMAGLDPQSEVVFQVACAECARQQRVLFDIAEHLWLQLDRWARSLLREIHRLASAYGWSESSVLSMSVARRRAYLALVGEY